MELALLAAFFVALVALAHDAGPQALFHVQPKQR
jgi:hypothetical protein